MQKDCQLGCSGTVTVWPDIDGYFLPAGVPDIFAAGKQNDVATVSGFTRDESSNALRAAGDLEAYVAAAHKLYGDQAERFLKLYPAASDAEAKAMGVTAAREGQAEAGTRNWALAQSATGKAPFYMYMFSRVHPFAEGVKFFDDPKSIGAYHTSDVPYWFGTQDAFNKFRVTRDWTPFDRDLSDRMEDCLVAFARTGDPSTAATPWPRWTPEGRELRRIRRPDRRARGKCRANGVPHAGQCDAVDAARLAGLIGRVGLTTSTMALRSAGSIRSGMASSVATFATDFCNKKVWTIMGAKAIW